MTLVKLREQLASFNLTGYHTVVAITTSTFPQGASDPVPACPDWYMPHWGYLLAIISYAHSLVSFQRGNLNCTLGTIILLLL